MLVISIWQKSKRRLGEHKCEPMLNLSFTNWPKPEYFKAHWDQNSLFNSQIEPKLNYASQKWLKA